MSFRTQRLANRFPLWTKVRSDPSSMGSRLLQTFAEGLEENSITAQRLVENLVLGKRSVGRGFLHEIILEGDDVLVPSETASGYEWEYPVVTGTVGADVFTVEKLDTLTDMLCSFPTRFSTEKSSSHGSRVIWESSAPYTYSALDYVDRLWVKVEGSTSFVNKSLKRDREKSGIAAITILGVDKSHNTFSEVITIVDDGVYVTSFAFMQVTEILYEGFNGTVTVTLGPDDLPFELDPYRVLVFDDMEGPLKLELESGALSYVTYVADRFKTGKQYRRPGIETLNNEEAQISLLLQDSDGVEYEALSIAVSPNNTYLYSLDTLGRVHVHDHTMPEFIAPAANDTVASYMDIVPLAPYARFGRTEYLWTRFSRMRYPIAWIQIKRTSPLGTVSYLQSDKTWGVSVTNINYPLQAKAALNQWKDFRFSTEYDETGTWEYELTTKSTVDTTVFVVSVCCASLVANVTIDTEMVGLSSLYFDDNGYLVVDTGTVAYFLNEHVDKYIIDEELSHIWLSDEYDSIEVN